jgi:citrate/tricarballylate utilization protein
MPGRPRWARCTGATASLALATVAALALFLVLVLALRGTLLHEPLAGNFYAVFPHNLMVALFGAAFGWAVLALGVGATKFWRGQSPGPVTGAAAGEAAHHAFALTYLDGGHHDGCNESDDRFTLARRRFHHLTFYGFLLCFASTCVATLYHYAGQPAPYAVTSLPVVLGTWAAWACWPVPPACCG